jgi:hypothetical protein
LLQDKTNLLKAFVYSLSCKLKRPAFLRSINYLLKGTIVILLLFVLWKQVIARDDSSELAMAFVGQLRQAQWPWLIAVIALMPVNWGLEALKWRQLVHSFSGLGFWGTMRAVLCGVALSMLTPNRMGDYLGRLLGIEFRHSVKAVAATAVGNFSQLIVLLGAGLVGFLYFSSHYWLGLEIQSWKIMVPGICGAALLLWGYFHIDAVGEAVRKLPENNKIQQWLRRLSILEDYRAGDLGRVLLMSLARYSVYTFQYYLMLRFYSIDPPVGAALAGIASIYLIQSSVPLPPLAALLARGEIALLVWAPFSANELGILAATFSLFIINLGVPALLGTTFIVKKNLIKSLGYEKTFD